MMNTSGNSQSDWTDPQSFWGVKKRTSYSIKIIGAVGIKSILKTLSGDTNPFQTGLLFHFIMVFFIFCRRPSGVSPSPWLSITKTRTRSSFLVYYQNHSAVFLESDPFIPRLPWRIYSIPWLEYPPSGSRTFQTNWRVIPLTSALTTSQSSESWADKDKRRTGTGSTVRADAIWDISTKHTETLRGKSDLINGETLESGESGHSVGTDSLLLYSITFNRNWLLKGGHVKHIDAQFVQPERKFSPT